MAFPENIKKSFNFWKGLECHLLSSQKQCAALPTAIQLQKNTL
tara:strand:+ start:414 stop:542 length:129 start_codon:yes stop_codon:yes gene_type:complete